jgi:uncharacterized protein (TIGR00251 family)
MLAKGDGVLVPVRAQPGARADKIVGEHAGAVKIAVRAPPEDGRANRALAELLAASLDLRKGDVELASGASSRDKKFLVRGRTPADLARRLAHLVLTPR